MNTGKPAQPTPVGASFRRCRRTLILGFLAALAAVQPVRGERIRMLIQSSPLAGAQYYALGKVIEAMQVGDELQLVREPGNRHDAKAVRVEWRGHKLGYLPRAENGAVAAALDAGDSLTARISRLRQETDPWRRLEIQVFLNL